MTISDWFFAGYSTPNIVPISPAANLGRNFTPTRSVVYNPAGFPVGTPTPLRPMAIENPITSDQWGVSFPGGTIGVTNAVARQTPAGGPFSSDWSSFWTYMAQNQTSISGSGGIPTVLLIPSTLPGSYTKRLKRDWHSGTNGAQLQANSGSYLLRTADGYTLYKWIPDNRINGWLSTGFFSNVSFPGIRANLYGEGVGFRKVQYQLGMNAGGPYPFFTGSINMTASHNSDGSFLGAWNIGTSVDFTRSHTVSDFTQVGATSRYISAWIDMGQILATLGNWTQSFAIQGDVNSVGGAGFTNLTCDVRISPRVDVPLPFTVTGTGDLIVPGGTV